MTRSHRLVVAIGLVVLAAPIVLARQQTAAQLFQRGLMLERAEGKVAEAVVLYERVVTEFPADRVTVPEALLQLSRAYETQRDPRAVGVLTRLVDGFPATSHAAEGRKRLAAIQAAEPFKPEVLAFGDRFLLNTDFSRDGRYVAFVQVLPQPLRTGGRGTMVRLRELTGRRNERALLDDGVVGVASALRFSRDSRRIAMLLPAGRGAWEMRVLSVDGKTPPVSVKALPEEGLGWSPDSRWIAHKAPVDSAGSADLKLLDVTTGATESLNVRLQNRAAEFRWSRDGETLAFWATPSADTNPQEVQVVNRRTGQTRRVAIAKPANASLSLGKLTTTGEIAVWQNSGAGREGYLVSLTNGEKRPMCSVGPRGGCWDVSWEGANAVVLDETTQRLALRDFASGLDRPLTWGGGPSEERSSWRSPDGRVNVFLSNRDGSWGIYAALLDRLPNMNPVKLATIGDDPLGTEVWWTNTGLVLRTTRQQSRLYRVPMDPATGRTSGAAQLFGESSEFRDVPVASPDGKRVAVFQRSSVRSSINILDASGKFERTVFETYRFVRAAPRMAWRSNEELIIDDFRATSNDPVAMVTANLRTSRVQTLPNSTIESRDWRYVPGLDELLYNLEREGAPPVLKARSLATGADRTVKVFTTPGESVQDFQVSNDGKQIVLQTANSCMNAPCQLRVLTIEGADVRVIGTAPTRGQSWSGIQAVSPDNRFLVSGREIIATDGGARWPWGDAQPSASLTGRGVFSSGATWSVIGTSLYVSLRGNVFEYRRWEGVTSDAIAKVLSSKPR